MRGRDERQCETLTTIARPREVEGRVPVTRDSRTREYYPKWIPHSSSYRRTVREHYVVNGVVRRTFVTNKAVIHSTPDRVNGVVWRTFVTNEAVSPSTPERLPRLPERAQYYSGVLS